MTSIDLFGDSGCSRDSLRLALPGLLPGVVHAVHAESTKRGGEGKKEREGGLYITCKQTGNCERTEVQNSQC